jgi:hypothetical protein
MLAESTQKVQLNLSLCLLYVYISKISAEPRSAIYSRQALTPLARFAKNKWPLFDSIYHFRLFAAEKQSAAAAAAHPSALM